MKGVWIIGDDWLDLCGWMDWMVGLERGWWGNWILWDTLVSYSTLLRREEGPLVLAGKV